MPNFICSLNLQEENESYIAQENPYSESIKVEEKSHQCHICTKCFPDEENLVWHRKFIHDEKEDTVHCVVCQKLFESENQMKYHFQTVHEGVKPEMAETRSKDHEMGKKHVTIHPLCDCDNFLCTPLRLQSD